MIGGYSGIPSTGSAPNLTGYNSSGMPQYGSQSLASLTNRNGLSGLNGLWSRGAYGAGMSDDDVIPTAIVIKNIPFAVPREQLLGVIESLGAPLPYAFNYHHDNGIFRGLAFANFRAPDEAASVVAALNGYDVQGRKLRVEYKKVLQPGEKDKIEREKALKRMRSIQFDSAVMKDVPPPLNIMPPPPHPHQQQHHQPQQQQQQQHHQHSHSQSIAINRPPSQHLNGHANPHLSESFGAAPEAESPPHSASSATSESQNLPMNLDLNDSMALDIYSRVLVFKEDRMRDELSFSKSLTPTERRIVHLVANKLGLTSITKGGEGEVKHVVVTREAAPRPALTTSNSANVGGSYLSPYGTTQAEVSPSLRIKKSMPDLRGFNGPVVARDPARSLTPQRSSGNLRGDANGQPREYVSMGASSGRRANGLGSGNFNGYFGSPVDGAPPVPPLPAGLGLHASKSSSSVTGTSPDNLDGRDPGSAPLRNPRGPAGDARGFALRSSASGVLRSQANGPGGFGRTLTEEEEDEYDEAQQQQGQAQAPQAQTPPQPQAHEPEGARTRDSVEV
jgi:RNA recognition motif-containing protein